jgi:hypothetical protein
MLHSLNRTVRTTVIASALALFAATPALADSIFFEATIDGPQSIATGATPPETRTGTGFASLELNLDTGLLFFDISFQGLIGADVTPNSPFNGSGLLVAHFHVGDRVTNGPIPVGILDTARDANNMLLPALAPNVMGPGFTSALGPDVNGDGMPDLVFTGATSGRFTGFVDIFGLADANGNLRAGVSAQTFLNSFLVDVGQDTNAYINLHTFNNINGEIRGQIVRVAQPRQVAEPVSGGLLALGLAALAFRKRRS